jgi:dihydropteroate synthase
MRILKIKDPRQIKRLMQDIRVDPYGIRIMLPKAITHLVKINAVSNIAANILKQEMLSLGAEVAVCRGALTGESKKTDCLMMGTLSQFRRLNIKLNRQPFGLGSLAKELAVALNNYEQDRFVLQAANRRIPLVSRTLIMGIINVTPDSFSSDGIWSESGIKTDIANLAQRLVKEGADIIDIGGESSRPGANPVPLKEELIRVIPAIKAIAKKVRIPISVDTSKPEVARLALDNGAVIVNDISGLRNPQMARIVARNNAGVIIMHMKGTPRNMQSNPTYASLMDEIIQYLKAAQERALDAGVKRENIVIDPGIGFGKSLKDNLSIINNLSELKVLGEPILVGTSRKSFIGKILNSGPSDRVFGTVSTCILAAKNGAHIVRTHDVSEVKQALRIFDEIKKV